MIYINIQGSGSQDNRGDPHKSRHKTHIELWAGQKRKIDDVWVVPEVKCGQNGDERYQRIISVMKGRWYVIVISIGVNRS